MALADTLFIFIMVILQVTGVTVLGDSMAQAAAVAAVVAVAITAVILMAVVAAVAALVVVAALGLREVTLVAALLLPIYGIRAQFLLMLFLSPVQVVTGAMAVPVKMVVTAELQEEMGAVTAVTVTAVAESKMMVLMAVVVVMAVMVAAVDMAVRVQVVLRLAF